MKQHNLGSRPLSRLMLGTVQFGVPYGVANAKGQPSYEEARDIVRAAHEGGIDSFDTAPGYGTSEEILGRAFSELGIQDRVHVVSKIPAMPAGLSPSEAEANLERSVRHSLEKLKIKALQVCLFHSEDDARHMKSLERLKIRGLVESIGVSVETLAGARRALDTVGMDAMQVPASLLDRRFTQHEIAGLAASKDMDLFARSVYLQGLLFLSTQEVPKYLGEILTFRSNFEKIAIEAGMSLSEMSLRYVLSLPEITSVLVGVESRLQIKQNLEILSKGALGGDLMEKIRGVAVTIPENLLRPSQWPGLRDAQKSLVP